MSITMQAVHHKSKVIRTFGNRVRADSARSIALLKAIDETLCALNSEEKQFDLFLENAHEFLDRINDAEEQGTIDAEGKVAHSLERAQNELSQYIDLLNEKLGYAKADFRLTGDDGIEDAYGRLIATIEELHDTVNTLRWAIGEHDVDNEPRENRKAYDVEDLDVMFADLER